MSGPLLHHHIIIKGAAVAFVPLEADVLFNMSKDTPTDYTKTGGGNWNDHAYRDINYQIDSEIREIGITNQRHISGFYDKTIGDAFEPNNFSYCWFYTTIPQNIVQEMGVQKFADAGLHTDKRQIKRIVGAAEYSINDILKFTSLQDFAVGQFACTIRATGESIQNVEFQL